jgi:hypothetical protein
MIKPQERNLRMGRIVAFTKLRIIAIAEKTTQASPATVMPGTITTAKYKAMALIIHRIINFIFTSFFVIKLSLNPLIIVYNDL